MWGTGLGFAALGGPVTYTPENPFARFKGIAYHVLPTSQEADGLVCLELARPLSEVRVHWQALQDALFRLLGGRPNYHLLLEEMRPAGRDANHTEVIVRVAERHASGKCSFIHSSIDK
ncbi:unnamed protein product [Protopolystoma xenopodis]|uniref:Uncharacterized protein n=1 Tax=Protopolystoma xenopodis TaxID=117903 RepID=A0A3S5CV58_9PLAT|nr:unnamed protein product [Protopolystoma xenopodis]